MVGSYSDCVGTTMRRVSCKLSASGASARARSQRGLRAPCPEALSVEGGMIDMSVRVTMNLQYCRCCKAPGIYGVKGSRRSRNWSSSNTMADFALGRSMKVLLPAEDQIMRCLPSSALPARRQQQPSAFSGIPTQTSHLPRLSSSNERDPLGTYILVALSQCECDVAAACLK